MPPISSFLSLYGAGEHYTISGETTLDGGTLNAVYDVAVASTLMGVVIKLRGKHIVAAGQLTLLDNNQTSVACSAGITYSEFSDVTQIVISPQGTNTIGGAGSSWSLSGNVTIDGNIVSVEVTPPQPSVTITCVPALPDYTGTTKEVTFDPAANITDILEHVVCRISLGAESEPITAELRNMGADRIGVYSPNAEEPEWMLQGDGTGITYSLYTGSPMQTYYVYSLEWV